MAFSAKPCGIPTPNFGGLQGGPSRVAGRFARKRRDLAGTGRGLTFGGEGTISADPKEDIGHEISTPNIAPRR
jgi:hypothetical protein